VTPGSPATASSPAVPSTPISPNVWIAGVDNPIIIKGSGFTSQAVGDCIATQVIASEAGGPSGSEVIPISNIKIVDDNTITAVVTPPAITAAATPAASGTMETGYITLNGTAPPEGDNSASATVQITPVLVQAQNVTPTLKFQPEQAAVGTSAAQTAHLTLGGTFQFGLGYKQTDGTFQAIPSTFALGTPTLSGNLDDNALFPDNAVFQYTNKVNDAVVLQATHLGTQPLTITPNDTSIQPVNITLSVEEPESLGSSHGDLDTMLYPLADDTGVPPEMIKGQVATEGGFNRMAWRYEPLNAIVGDFAYSTTKDLRTNAHYGSSLRLPTIGDSVNPGNCGTNATIGNVKVIVNGVPSNGVSSLSPPSGAPGTPVTITGTNFGPSQSAVSGAVTVNGVNAVITSWSSTSITAVVPNYDYTTHVDSRIPDPRCVGLEQGATFSPQVMNDLLQQIPPLWIPQRDPETGAVLMDNNGNPLLRQLSASDRYVSVHDLFVANNQKLGWGRYAKNPSRVATVQNGTVDFSAQLSLAASYGLLQVTYATAIDQKWAGNAQSCGPADLRDPDNLFDTPCNLANGGGSLGIGTRLTEKNFANYPGVTPSLTNEPSLEAAFSNAYQKYNSGMTGYGAHVISNTRSFEPSPTGAIFATGGQQ
jgi:hypothetical protein